MFFRPSFYFLDDTTDERVGRALRKQGNEPDSLSQSRKTNTSCSLEMQNTTQSQITSVHDVQMERGNISKRQCTEHFRCKRRMFP